MISIDNFSAIPPEFAAWLPQAVTSVHGLWSTRESENVASSMPITEGAPPVTGVTATLDGNWERWGWKDAGSFSTVLRSFEI